MSPLEFTRRVNSIAKQAFADLDDAMRYKFAVAAALGIEVPK